MKLSFSLKSKEASLEADVEGLIKKGLDQQNISQKKTRYQIKQEEKRKKEELQHKQKMQQIFITIGIFAVILILALVMTVLE